jgi:hypothetical protein
MHNHSNLNLTLLTRDNLTSQIMMVLSIRQCRLLCYPAQFLPGPLYNQQVLAFSQLVDVMFIGLN